MVSIDILVGTKKSSMGSLTVLFMQLHCKLDKRFLLHHLDVGFPPIRRPGPKGARVLAQWVQEEVVEYIVDTERRPRQQQRPKQKSYGHIHLVCIAVCAVLAGAKLICQPSLLGGVCNSSGRRFFHNETEVPKSWEVHAIHT